MSMRWIRVCSMRGTNNRLPNRFRLCNIRYKLFFHLQLFDVKFLFSENHIFRKQKRTAVYGRTSLVLDFKLNWENDDLLSSRNK